MCGRIALASCRKVEALIRTSWCTKLYMVEGELNKSNNLSHICYWLILFRFSPVSYLESSFFLGISYIGKILYTESSTLFLKILFISQFFSGLKNSVHMPIRSLTDFSQCINKWLISRINYSINHFQAKLCFSINHKTIELLFNCYT